MNKKYYKLMAILVLVLAVSGCTKSFQSEGKTYTENILCRPEKQETIEVYKKNNIDITKYPKCSEFSISKTGYEGLWNTAFVKPLALLLLKLGEILNSYGLSIIITTLLLRMVMMPVTAKTAVQSENMKDAQPELEKLENKYKDKKDRDSLMQKSQEQLVIYKKYNIKPMSGCLFALIQIPLFFAFLEAINRLPVLFEENFLGLFELKRTPMEAFKLGQHYYIIFIILIIASTYFSMKLNKTAAMSKEQENQMKMTSNISIVMISIFSFNLATGIGLYWIVNSGFTVLQNLVVRRPLKNVKNT